MAETLYEGRLLTSPTQESSLLSELTNTVRQALIPFNLMVSTRLWERDELQAKHGGTGK